MKRLLILTLLMAAVWITPCQAQKGTIYEKPTERWWSGSTMDPAWRWMKEVDPLIRAGSQIGTGSIFYVDSGVTTEGNGTTLATAKDTLDEAINLCTADAGDIIYVAQGHAETIAAANGWDADVAGITIVHLGNGSNQGTYTFSATGSTVAVGAANVTIIGGRLLAGISEVVVGLSVEATAHYFTNIGMDWPEPLITTYEFNIGVQLTSDVNDVSFIGCRASSAGATGADHWLNGGAAAVQRLTLVGNTIHGQYAIAPIFSDQADTETYIKYNNITQLTASQFGIEFTAAATGIVADNRVNATVLFEVDPGSMAYWNNMEGDTLPEGVSLNGQLGAFTGPAAGTAQDDNVKGSLDLAHTDLDAILVDTGTTLMAELYWQERTIAMTATSTTDDLFDVAGGGILVKNFFGLVTTPIGAVTNVIKIIHDADAGWVDTEFSTAVETNADAAGSLYVFSNANPSVLTPLTAGAAGGATTLGTQWIVGEGMVEQNSTGATTGAIVWYMTYVPLVTGVTVTAQ